MILICDLDLFQILHSKLKITSQRFTMQFCCRNMLKQSCSCCKTISHGLKLMAIGHSGQLWLRLWRKRCNLNLRCGQEVSSSIHFNSLVYSIWFYNVSFDSLDCGKATQGNVLNYIKNLLYQKWSWSWSYKWSRSQGLIFDLDDLRSFSCLMILIFDLDHSGWSFTIKNFDLDLWRWSGSLT